MHWLCNRWFYVLGNTWFHVLCNRRFHVIGARQWRAKKGFLVGDEPTMIYGCKCLSRARGDIIGDRLCIRNRRRSRWKYRHVSHRVKAQRRWHNAIVLARSEMKCARERARSRYIFFSIASARARAHTWHNAEKPGVQTRSTRDLHWRSSRPVRCLRPSDA